MQLQKLVGKNWGFFWDFNLQKMFHSISEQDLTIFEPDLKFFNKISHFLNKI